jgi:hypothetical protein
VRVRSAPKPAPGRVLPGKARRKRASAPAARAQKPATAPKSVPPKEEHKGRWADSELIFLARSRVPRRSYPKHGIGRAGYECARKCRYPLSPNSSLLQFLLLWLRRNRIDLRSGMQVAASSLSRVGRQLKTRSSSNKCFRPGRARRRSRNNYVIVQA